MIKNNFLERRVYERDRRELEKTIYDYKRYLNMLRRCEKYIKSYEAKEAYQRIKDYSKNLVNEEELCERKIDKLRNYAFHHYRQICNHEIIYRDHRSLSFCECVLCTSPLNKETLDPQGKLIIVDNKLHCNEEPWHWKKDIIFDALEYMVANDLEYTEEEFLNAVKITNPEATYDFEEEKVYKKGD